MRKVRLGFSVKVGHYPLLKNNQSNQLNIKDIIPRLISAQTSQSLLLSDQHLYCSELTLMCNALLFSVLDHLCPTQDRAVSCFIRRLGLESRVINANIQYISRVHKLIFATVKSKHLLGVQKLKKVSMFPLLGVKLQESIHAVLQLIKIFNTFKRSPKERLILL